MCYQMELREDWTTYVHMHIVKLIKSCRVYNGPTKLWKSVIGTDHKLLVMGVEIPFGKKQKRYIMKKRIIIKDPRYNMAVLR